MTVGSKVDKGGYVDVEVVQDKPRGGGMPGTPQATTQKEAKLQTEMKPEKKSGSGWGHAVLAPVKWAAKTAVWLATPSRSGGAQYIMYALSFGCFSLSAENFYVAMHPEAHAEHRFVYKLGLVNDEADMARLIPLPAVLEAINNTAIWVANSAGAKITNNYHPKVNLIVWADPKFYAAIVGAFALSALQAVLTRQVSFSTRKRQLEDAQRRDVEVDAVLTSAYQRRIAARPETVVRQEQVKHYGTGQILGFGSLVAIAYLIEFMMFAAAAVPGTPFFQSLILAIASTVGTEATYGLAKTFEEREDYT